MPSPGLSGFRMAHEDQRTQQQHGMNMQTQQAQLDQIMREAEEWEANAPLRDKQRQLEKRQTGHALENFDQMAALDMLAKQSEVQQSALKAASAADSMLIDAIPEDAQNMSNSELRRIRERFKGMGMDPDELGLPSNMNAGGIQQLQQRRNTALQSVEHNQNIQLAWENQRAGAWRDAQKLHLQDQLGGNEEGGFETSQGKLTSDRNLMLGMADQIEQQYGPDDPRVAQFREDAQMLNDYLVKQASDPTSPAREVGSILRQIGEGEAITPGQLNVLKANTMAGNPNAAMIFNALNEAGLGLGQELLQGTGGQPNVGQTQGERTRGRSGRGTPGSTAEQMDDAVERDEARGAALLPLNHTIEAGGQSFTVQELMKEMQEENPALTDRQARQRISDRFGGE